MNRLSTQHSPKQNLWQRLRPWIGSIDVWIFLSVSFVMIARISDPDSEEATNLWFLEPLTSLIFLVLLRIQPRFDLRKKITLTRWQAACAFVLISWVVGMLIELTISVGGNSYGGLHPETGTSFLLAQGYYIPLAVLGLWLVRRYQLTLRELFFVAGMTCLFEVIQQGIPILLSPVFFMAPLLIAFYFVIYSKILSMGLLVIDERLLWDHSTRSISFARKLGYGFAVGIACWVIFMVWATLVFGLLGIES